MDLTDLENRLTTRWTEAESPDLRARVIDAAQCELNRRRQAVADDRAWIWIGIAAAIFIVLNLSAMLASTSSISNYASRNREHVVRELSSVRQAETQLRESFR